MISNPARARLIKTGTYTGDGTAARQISVGFKCSCVWIATLTTPQRAFIIPSITVTDTNAAHNTDDTTDIHLHATDGFVVSDLGTVNLNFSTEPYYYWAIGE